MICRPRAFRPWLVLASGLLPLSTRRGVPERSPQGPAPGLARDLIDHQLAVPGDSLSAFPCCCCRVETWRAQLQAESDRQTLFRLRRGFLVPPWLTFPRAPLSSRTVGFPESGWQRQLSPKDLPSQPEVQALARIHPWVVRLYLRLDDAAVAMRTLALCPDAAAPYRPLPAESPFARAGRYPPQGDVPHLLDQRYLVFVAHIGSCAPPYASGRLCFSLVRLVFAGCCKPLLAEGGSRRYLRDLCEGAWTHTPPRLSRRTRSKPGEHRPSPN